jgi:hypothetical protein
VSLKATLVDQAPFSTVCAGSQLPSSSGAADGEPEALGDDVEVPLAEGLAEAVAEGLAEGLVEGRAEADVAGVALALGFTGSGQALVSSSPALAGGSELMPSSTTGVVLTSGASSATWSSGRTRQYRVSPVPSSVNRQSPAPSFRPSVWLLNGVMEVRVVKHDSVLTSAWVAKPASK